MTTLYGRQGDLIIDKLNAPISGDLEKTKRLTFAGDSTGHPHRLLGDILFRQEGRRTLVRVAKASSIEHGRTGGHEPVRLVPGDYSIGPMRERGDATDRPVED